MKLLYSIEYKILMIIEEVWKSIIMLEVCGVFVIGIVVVFGLVFVVKKYNILYIEEF